MSFIKRLHHVGIVATNRQTVETFMRIFGADKLFSGYVEAYQCECLFARVGNFNLEFLFAEEGPIARFRKGGGGIHHLAFEVEEMPAALKALKSQGVDTIEQGPVKGAGDFIIHFIHPFMFRFTVELVQAVPKEKKV